VKAGVCTDQGSYVV